MNTHPHDPHIWHLVGCLAITLSTGITVTLIGAAIYILTR